MSRTRVQRTYLAIVGAAAAVAVAGGVFAAWAGTSTAAPTVAPQNVGEPAVSGTTRVGQVLRTTRGTWTGTPPITYEFRWFRCTGPGAPDASDCRRISNAADNTYVLRRGRCGLPHPLADQGDEHRRVRAGDVKPHEHRDLGAAHQHARAEHLRIADGR